MAGGIEREPVNDTWDRAFDIAAGERDIADRRPGADCEAPANDFAVVERYP